MKNLNNTGVTLLEILLASIIFVISVAGIFATLNAVRVPVANKENSLAAAVFGKQILETLRTQVNAGTAAFYGTCSSGAGTVASPCQDFSLTLGTHLANMPAGLTWPSADPSSNNAGISYTVSCADGSGSYGNPNTCLNADVAHKLDLNINW